MPHHVNRCIGVLSMYSSPHFSPLPNRAEKFLRKNVMSSKTPFDTSLAPLPSNPQITANNGPAHAHAARRAAYEGTSANAVGKKVRRLM